MSMCPQWRAVGSEVVLREGIPLIAEVFVRQLPVATMKKELARADFAVEKLLNVLG